VRARVRPELQRAAGQGSQVGGVGQPGVRQVGMDLSEQPGQDEGAPVAVALLQEPGRDRQRVGEAVVEGDGGQPGRAMGAAFVDRAPELPGADQPVAQLQEEVELGCELRLAQDEAVGIVGRELGGDAVVAERDGGSGPAEQAAEVRQPGERGS